MSSVACYVVFNEIQFLEKSVGSLIDGMDKVILVEGAWLAMPSEGIRSNDGTLELLKRLKAKYRGKVEVVAPDQRTTEIEARNLYLEALRPGDWFLQIDADEFIRGDLSTGLREANSSPEPLFGIRMVEKTRTFYRRKLFRMEEGMRYVEGLPSIQEIYTSPPFPVLEEFWLEHLFHDRWPERDWQREESYRRGGATAKLALRRGNEARKG